MINPAIPDQIAAEGEAGAMRNRKVFYELHESLSDDLDRIRNRFTGNVKVSLVVRVSDTPGGSLYLTDDETPKVIEAIMQREKDSEFVFNPITPKQPATPEVKP